MVRQETRSLFDEPGEEPEPPGPDAPLAERMRPRSLEEFVGQGHLIGPGSVLRRLMEGSGTLPSLILWGAPGTGKVRQNRRRNGPASRRSAKSTQGSSRAAQGPVMTVATGAS